VEEAKAVRDVVILGLRLSPLELHILEEFQLSVVLSTSTTV
jgi:hypothetical protein